MPEDKKKKRTARPGDEDVAAFDAFEKKKKAAKRAKTASAAKRRAGAKTAKRGKKKRKQKNAWWTWPVTVFMLLVLTGLGAMAVREKLNYEEFVVMRETVDTPGFYAGISIDGVDVSGRSLSDVLSSVGAHEESLKSSLNVRLSCGSQSWTITADELDYASDYESVVRSAYQIGHEGSIAQRYQAIRQLQANGANYTITRGYDTTLLRAITDMIAGELSVAASDAQIESFDMASLSFNYAREQAGTYVDAEQLYQNTLSAIQSGTPGQTVVISQQSVAPGMTVSELSAQLGKIAEAKTTAGGTKNRLSNISLAVSTLNGLCVNPGETFSFNGAVGERTEAAGYKSAGAFSDGLLTEEIGGGICQVSTTLFNAVAKADLEIVARSPHSRPVSYVDKGKDAAVSWPNQDFKFMNDTDYPVYIVASFDTDSKTVYFAVYGKKLANGVYITIEAETLKEEQPGDPVYIYTRDLPTGQKELIEEARVGYYAESYKIYHNADGSEISRELFCRSTYPASGTRYRVGQ